MWQVIWHPEVTVTPPTTSPTPAPPPGPTGHPTSPPTPPPTSPPTSPHPPPTTPPAADGWRVAVTTGPAGAFHHRPIPTEPGPEVWIHLVDRPALVLGSSQPEGDLDREAAEAHGIEVCRRRSGGGLVGLTPDRDCWIDVIVPRRSSLWDDDVGRAFDFFGAAWVRAVNEVTGTGRALAHRGPLRGGPAGRVLCFASLGPGEVTLDDRKVVGISQRRTRDAARFQSVAVGRWDPTLPARFLRPEPLSRVGLDPWTVAAGVGDLPWAAPLSVAAALCRALPPLEPVSPE